MTEVDLLHSEVEEDLRATVRAVLRDRCPVDAVMAMYEGDRSAAEAVWKTLVTELGLAGLLVPEAQGGLGASAREAAVVLEELGRAVAPAPFLTSAVIATTVLLHSGSDLLLPLATGERTAALVVPWSLAPDAEIPALALEGDRVRGTVQNVAGALEADRLLVPVTSAGGSLELWAVTSAEAVVEPVTSFDMTRQLADVTFSGTAAERLLAEAEAPVRSGLVTGAALLASEQVAIARWCLESTLHHLKERRQFGRQLGSFQALKHRLADLYVAVESAAAAARYAAVTVATADADAAVAAALAQACCGDLAVQAAEEAVQLHGGTGMTWEHPTHLYLKRAKADQIGLGSPGRHRHHLGDLVGLPA